MHVVVGTDFSKQAQAAAETAARFARLHGDRVVVVHAMQMPVMSIPEAPVGLAGIEEGLRDAAARDLRRVADQLRALGAEVEERVVEGPADEALVEAGRALGARAVVVGSHGRRAWQRWILGSVAERVVQQADRPVIVVRERPGFAGVEGRPLRVMVGVDRGAAAASAVAWVRALRAVVPCEVTLVHFYWPPDEYRRLGLAHPKEPFGPEPEVVRVVERELREAAGPLAAEPDVRVRIDACWGTPAEALAQAAEEGGADLLVLGTRRSHGLALIWHGSVARVALRAASMPVAIVPIEEPRPAT